MDIDREALTDIRDFDGDPFDSGLLAQGARIFGLEFGIGTLRLFEAHSRFLSEQNTVFNLTSLTSENDIIVKHYIDSLSIFPAAAACLRKYTATGKRQERPAIIDIGSGAGFPSVPLKMAADSLRLDWKFTAIDSTAKKVRFIKEAADMLRFKDFEAVCARAEELAFYSSYREKFALSVSRAVAPLPVLIEYCLPFISRDGYLIAMKGTKEKTLHELNDSKKALSELGGEVDAVSDSILPFTDNERTVVIIRKFRQTPSIYPRKTGIPSRKPLK